jgi:hypothetical protein
MGIASTIQSALEKRLQTLSGLPPTEYPNVDFEPPADGSVWCRSTVMPGTPSIASMGVGGLNYYPGIYQVDVFSPKGKGAGDAETLAESIKALFTRGTTLTEDGETILCRLSWLAQPIPEETVWHQPVRVMYETYSSE